MTTPTLPHLNALLDELERKLPSLIEDYPEPGEFWMAFAGEADVIEDQTPLEHCQLVQARIAEMLAKHGRYIAFMDE